MFLDFEDHRPEAPRVPDAISRREGVLLSLVVHAIFLLAVLFPPFSFSAAPAAAVITPQRPPATFVMMAPKLDRQATPIRPPEASDADRRSATREQPKDAQNAMPFSRGDTPDKTEGAREDKPAGSEGATAPTSPSTSAADTVAKVLPESPAVPRPARGALGDSFRNLQRYLQGETFDNQRGGLTDKDPDIQFDSKGVEFGPWLRRFVSQVKRNWFIPMNAQTQSGRVVITFYVMKDGSIRDLQIVQPSGIGSFNTSALSALKMSNPTLPLPAEYPDDRAFFTVTFRYNDGLVH